MKTTISATVVAGMLLVAAGALSQTAWRKSGVSLGWVRQPNPDETGKSSAQRTKLLSEDTLTYSRVEQVESYVLKIDNSEGGFTMVDLRVPMGTAIDFGGGHCDANGNCERYDIDRANGKRATVQYSTNAPPRPPPSPVPNTGLVTQ
jgi:hypothetical protein